MPKAPARPWRTAGRYAIFDEIASGGMASIYLGRLSGPGGFSRAVAIKRLHPHLAGSQEFAASFLREARLAARVRHPNVVSIIDVFEDQTDVFLVMEFVVGASLSAVLGKLAAEGRQVPCAIASAILVPVLHGLHAAHETLDDQGSPLGLVHRDVSPQNVIVGADGVPYVLDFGIAKAAAEGDHTRDHVLKGKLSYLSPEQLKGDPVRRQADIYAACVVLWEMLTGSRLFREASAEATMHAVLTQPVLPPSSCAEGLPSRLNAIVLQGLARDPALRFQTARELADVLEVAVPPATAALLSTWVQSLCGESIAELRSRLSSAESATDAADTTTILPLLHAGQALPHDAGELATRVELRPRHDDGRVVVGGTQTFAN